jgi:hypothetical protein
MKQTGTIPDSAAGSRAAVNVRSIALPVQHGGWGFWMEPVLLGLLVAPSLSGVLLGITGLMTLLIHQPLRVAVKDLRKGKRYPRTDVALKFAALYGAILILAALGALLAAPDAIFLIPMLIAAPLGAIQLFYEMRNAGREALAEVTGALLFSALAPAVALLGLLPLPVALVLWVVQIARTVPSIFYVRARLRLEKGRPTGTSLAIGLHAFGLLVLAALAAAGSLPWLACLGSVILLARAVRGLSTSRRPLAAKSVGFLEIAYGLINAVLAAVGFALR